MFRATKITLAEAAEAAELSAVHGAIVPVAAVDKAVASRVSSVSPASSHPTTHAPAATLPQSTAAGAFNSSPECMAILWKRQPLEKMVDGARQQIAFHEKNLPNEYAARGLAFYRTVLADAVNALAVFDLETLTDECRDRLARFGVEFTYFTDPLVIGHIKRCAQNGVGQ